MAKENLKVLLRDPEKGGDIIEFFENIVDEFNFSIDVNFQYLSNKNLKNLIKISKMSDTSALLLKTDLLVQVNEEFFDNFDDETKKILFSQEIDKIEIDTEKGTIKLGKPSISANIGLIRKYTYEKVEQASETERLFQRQLSDAAEERKNAKKANNSKKQKNK